MIESLLWYVVVEIRKPKSILNPSVISKHRPRVSQLLEAISYRHLSVGVMVQHIRG